jgi:hypothetical protein
MIRSVSVLFKLLLGWVEGPASPELEGEHAPVEARLDKTRYFDRHDVKWIRAWPNERTFEFGVSPLLIFGPVDRVFGGPDFAFRWKYQPSVGFSVFGNRMFKPFEHMQMGAGIELGYYGARTETQDGVASALWIKPKLVLHAWDTSLKPVFGLGLAYVGPAGDAGSLGARSLLGVTLEGGLRVDLYRNVGLYLRGEAFIGGPAPDSRFTDGKAPIFGQGSAGLIIVIGRAIPEPPEPLDLDQDRDGYAGDLDLCPEAYGVFSGCPTTSRAVARLRKHPSDVVREYGMEDIYFGDTDFDDDERAKIDSEVEEAYWVKVYFAHGKSDIPAKAKRDIVDLAQRSEAQAIQDDRLCYRIHAFADTSGEEDTNRGLSEQRASAVHEVLLGQGITPNIIHATGHGETAQFSDRYEQNRVAVLMRVSCSSFTSSF